MSYPVFDVVLSGIVDIVVTIGIWVNIDIEIEYRLSFDHFRVAKNINFKSQYRRLFDNFTSGLQKTLKKTLLSTFSA